MSNATGLTLEEARARYRDYLNAEGAILLGQEYELSTREKLKRADLEKIRTGIKYWENKCNELANEEDSSIEIYPISLK